MSFFFDSHLHATLKKQFAHPDFDPPVGVAPRNPWHTASRDDLLDGFKAISLAKCMLRPFVESSLVSQSSLAQLNSNGYKLAVIALFAPDKGLMQLIVDNKPFIGIVKKGKFGHFLLATQFDKLLTNPPFTTLQNDLELLKLSNEGKSIVKLLDDQFNPAENDEMSVVFSIEGLHSLRTDMQQTNPEEIIADILKNLDSISDENRIISINITHIDGGNDVFANQAYAMDGFREAGFIETHLRPAGRGFTDAGSKIALELYKREILPDLKHMSWQSRREFYQFRKENNITAPLVSSHAGLTGCWFNNPLFKESISDFIVKFDQDEQINSLPQHKVVLSKPNPYMQSSGIGFNTSSINLFNEDIRAIFESDGLIGISLDQRILGYSDFKDEGNVVSKNIINIEGVLVITDSDFISPHELPLLPEYKQVSKQLDKIFRGVSVENRSTVKSSNVIKFYHLRHFFLQIVHAMEVARIIGQLNNSSAEEAAVTMLTRTLCIGSDFDGMIDGIDCCPDVSHMEDFKKSFIKDFGKFLKEVKLSLPQSLTVEKVADRIFYENGRDFVLRRLKAMNNV